jgi:hypothetical protein
MKNPFTEAEELEYHETLRERKLEQDKQDLEDALDLIDDGGQE